MKKGVLLSLLLMACIFLVGSPAWAQSKLSGHVTSSEDGQGLPGVNILIKGTGKGTVTDVDGNFTMDAPEDQASVLVFSFVGFVTQERALAEGPVFDITLVPDVKVLNEAVVVGYGTTNRRDLTGAVASVSSKDFQKGVVTTPEQLIAGKMAGVQVTLNSGQPGAGSTIRIRGYGSITENNDPLVVIDGVPVAMGGISGVGNPLAMINPNDIENITVLKDASAAAIYGSRASNGVILITTKKGTGCGKPQLSFYNMNTISFIRKKLSVLDADQFRRIVRDSGTPAQIALLGDSGVKTDWQDQIYQPAFASDNNLSVSGGLCLGDFKLPYRVSVGYLNQKGIIKTDELDRLTSSITINPSFLDGHLKFNINAKGSLAKQRFSPTPIGSAAAFDPTKPVYSDTSLADGGNPNRYGGFWEWTDPASGNPNQLAPRNPLGLIQQQQNISNVKRLIGNVQLDYAIHGFEDLHLNVNLGTDYSVGMGTVKITDSAASNYITHGSSTKYEQYRENNLLETYLSYNKHVDAIKSRFDVVAGYSFQRFKTYGDNFYNLSYRGDTVAGVAQPSTPNNYDENALISFYGRFNYALKERYLLTFNVRRDASSRFGPTARAGIFPSISLAWRIKDDLDDWFGGVKWLSDLKVRGGYGSLGNQEVGNYLYQPNYYYGNALAQISFDNNQTWNTQIRPVPYDAKIHWETSITRNIALDFAFLNSRIAGSVDFYSRRTESLLGQVQTPAGANFSDNLRTNVGAIENKGVEFTLNTVPVQTKDLRWDLGFNITRNENTVKRLLNVQDSNYVGIPTGSISGGVGSTVQIQTVGYSYSSFYVYEQKYGADGKPVDSQNLMDMFVDRNGDGQITDADKYRIQSLPKFVVGINTGVTYKAFSLSATLRGNFGNKVYNNVASERGNLNYIFSQPTYLANASSDYLASGFSGRNNNDRRLLSDYYVREATFIRLDNLVASYNLGNLISPKIGLTISAGVQNGFVITKYKGVDPEISGGIDNQFYARPRSFTFGLNFLLQ